MSSIQQLFNEALSALNSRNTQRAEEGFRRVVELDNSHVPALNLLTIVLMSLGRFREAEPFIARAVKLNQNSDVSFYNYGLIAKNLNKAPLALEQFTKALALNANVPETWNNRGTVRNELRQYELAISDFNKAISINPSYADGYANKGKSLGLLKRYDEAFAAFDRALSIKPDFAEAWLGLGNICGSLERYDEALAAYDKALSFKPDLAGAWLGRGNVYWSFKRHDEALAAYDKALSIKSDLEDAWLGRGNCFFYLKRYDEASAAYNKALSIKPDLAGAWLNRGNVYWSFRRHDEASAAYDKALSIEPNLAGAWLGRGNVHWSLKRFDEALAAYGHALSIKSDLEDAWLGRGNCFFDLKRYDEAFAAYDKALSINPDLESVEGLRLHTKMLLCNWNDLEKEIGHLTNAIRAGKVNSHPFALLSLTDLPDDHLRCAKARVAVNHPQSSEASAIGVIYRHDKIRVGYVSPDFCEHPVGYLTAGIFENHNSNRFETYAFSLGPGDNSDLRNRLEKSFHRFIDCQYKRDDEVLEAIKAAQIDIVIDLAGHTQDARLSLFASRPAPIAVNYLGFAGTIGSEQGWDYIISDPVVLHNDNKRFFQEKIARLPGSFMPRDDNQNRKIGDTIFSRADYGLPNDGVVFCCFNNAYKINPTTFDCWMKILKSVDQSVLWLSDMMYIAKSNLRKEAEKRGVDADRLVFAKRLASSSEHLARHCLADLFLDTLPYNAHTTASDALWAGLPVLTQIGNSFAARVAASMLTAIGLPELITHSREEYEALAIDLALNKQKLQAIREKLKKNRLTTPLFDTAQYTKHLEAAYEAMYQRHQAGLPPDHLEIEA